jgi:hypothetical protein
MASNGIASDASAARRDTGIASDALAITGKPDPARSGA